LLGELTDLGFIVLALFRNFHFLVWLLLLPLVVVGQQDVGWLFSVVQGFSSENTHIVTSVGIVEGFVGYALGAEGGTHFID
jgi:hypothetical protein